MLLNPSARLNGPALAQDNRSTLTPPQQRQLGEENQVIIPAGVQIQLMLREPVSSKLSEVGDEVLAVVRKDVVVEGQVVLPEGTEIVGRITQVNPAGRLLKGGSLHLTFERVRLASGERRLSAIVQSAADFTRDEKVKTNGEGTLKGGKDGGKVLQNVGTAAGLAGMGASVVLLAGIWRNGFGNVGGIGGGTLAGYGAIIGGSALAGILFSKGKEVRLDENTLIRLKLERPISVMR